MSRTIYTLGPQGTDSEMVGHMVGSEVVLCKDFRSAFEEGVRREGDVVCPAGYVRVIRGALVECWADLHFEFEAKFREIRCFRAQTQEMVLYESERVRDGRLICHPTTLAIARALLADPVEYVHVDSKPVGRTLYEQGQAQYVLCSRVNSGPCSWEHEVAVHNPSMVWVHYLGPKVQP